MQEAMKKMKKSEEKVEEKKDKINKADFEQAPEFINPLSPEHTKDLNKFLRGELVYYKRYKKKQLKTLENEIKEEEIPAPSENENVRRGVPEMKLDLSGTIIPRQTPTTATVGGAHTRDRYAVRSNKQTRTLLSPKSGISMFSERPLSAAVNRRSAISSPKTEFLAKPLSISDWSEPFSEIPRSPMSIVEVFDLNMRKVVREKRH